MFSKDVAATSWMEEPVWQCLFEALDLIVLQTTKAKAAWLKAKAAMINTAAGDEAPVSSDVTPCVECHSLCGMLLNAMQIDRAVYYKHVARMYFVRCIDRPALPAWVTHI